MNKTFLRFWLILSVITAGSVTLQSFDIFAEVYDKDVTKLSFVIMAMHLAYTFVIGHSAWGLSDQTGNTFERRAKAKRMKEKVSFGWFLSETMLGLGMTGTVIGFIIMLGGSMGELDMNNAAKTTEVLANMAVGMSTALYTTAVGLVCSILLKIQLVNLEAGIPNEQI